MNDLLHYLPGLIVMGICFRALHYVTRLQRGGILRSSKMPREIFNILETPDEGAQVTLWRWHGSPTSPPRIGMYSKGAFYGVSGDVSIWFDISDDWGWVYG